MRTGAQLRILVVEDDPMVRRALGRALGARGFAVFIAARSNEARSPNEHFDVGVFDIDLPDGDGIALAEELMRRGTVHAALFFSGRTDADLVQRAEQLGPFIAKSLGASAVVAAIPQLIAKALKAIAAGGEDVPLVTGPLRTQSGVRRKVPQ